MGPDTKRRTQLSPLAAPILALATACVIPPQLDQASPPDGGVNAFPALIEIDPSFPSPGPIAVSQQDQRDMSFRVRDTDLNDTIYVYLFRDYNYPDPTPHLSSCQDSTNELERDLTCKLNRLCGFTDGTDTIHVLEAMITDRELSGDGEPLYRALPVDAGYSFRTWLMTCAQ